MSGSGLNVQQTDVKAARALILSNSCSGQTMVQPTVPMSDAGAMAMGDGTASQLLVLQTLSASCELDEISNVVNSSGTMPEKTAAPVALSAIIVDDSMLYSFSAASRPVGPGIRSPLSLIMNTVDVAHQLIASGAPDDFISANEQRHDQLMTANQKLGAAIYRVVCNEAPARPLFTTTTLGDFLRARLTDLALHVENRIPPEGALVLLTSIYVTLADSYAVGDICWQNFQIFFTFVKAWVEFYPGFEVFIFVIEHLAVFVDTERAEAERKGNEHDLVMTRKRFLQQHLRIQEARSLGLKGASCATLANLEAAWERTACEKYDAAAGAEKAKAVEKAARETAEIKVATDTDQSAAMATNVAAKELVKAIAKAVKTAHFAADTEP